MTMPNALRPLMLAASVGLAASADAALMPIYADCDPSVPVWNGAGVNCSAVPSQTDATQVNQGAPDGNAYSLGTPTIGVGVTGVAVFQVSSPFPGSFSIYDFDDGLTDEAADVFVALADGSGDYDGSTSLYVGTVSNGGANPALAVTALTVAGFWDFIYIQDASLVQYPGSNTTDGFDIDSIDFGDPVRVPEPSSLLLSLLGLASLGLIRRCSSICQ
jgi:hypothetical protein